MTSSYSRDPYYLPNADAMFRACGEYTAALPAAALPFRLFVIINVCGGLNLSDAAFLYERFHTPSCAQVEPTTSRPMLSSRGAVQSQRPFAAEAARWEAGFYAPIAAAGLPRPFFLPVRSSTRALVVPTRPFLMLTSTSLGCSA